MSESERKLLIEWFIKRIVDGAMSDVLIMDEFEWRGNYEGYMVGYVMVEVVMALVVHH